MRKLLVRVVSNHLLNGVSVNQFDKQYALRDITDNDIEKHYHCMYRPLSRIEHNLDCWFNGNVDIFNFLKAKGKQLVYYGISDKDYEEISNYIKAIVDHHHKDGTIFGHLAATEMTKAINSTPFGVEFISNGHYMTSLEFFYYLRSQYYQGDTFEVMSMGEITQI